MANQVIASPQAPYIELVLDGVQTEQTVNSLAYEVLAELELFKRASRAGLILVNLEKVARSHPSAFDATLDVLNRHGEKFKKMAEYGAPNALLGRLTKYAVDHFGDPSRFRYFKTRPEAEAWLLADDPAKG